MSTEPLTRADLRADLAEQRLAIQNDIHAAVKPIAERQIALDRAEFTDAQEARMKGIAEGVITGQVNQAWSTRARIVTVVSVIISAMSLFTTAALAAHTIFGG